MKSEDCRRLSPEQQEEIRRRAVRMVQDGMPPTEVARVLKVAPASLFTWLARYRNGGWGALKTGARSGRPRKLDGKQMKAIFEIVTQKNPLQLNFPFALWTCEMIAKLIARKWGIELSRWSVSRLLKQLGLTPQRPNFRAWEQDPEQARRWASRQFPAIRAYAKRTQAKLYFADEASVRSDHHAGRTWAERGKTPVIRATGQRFSCNMISAISPGGTLRFMVTDQRMSSELFCEFIDRIMAGEDGKVLLIVDGHPAHRAKKTQAHVAKYQGQFRLYILPGYSPELNPDEHVWNWIKTHEIGKKLPEHKAQLITMVRNALHKLQRLPHILKAFFKDPHLTYIKANDFCSC